MSPALRESLLLICGILLGIVAGAAIMVYSNAPADPTAAAEPAATPRPPAAAVLASGPPAQTACPIRPLLAARGPQDGQRLPPADVQGRPAEEVDGLLLAGKEAAAGGQLRDAEVAYLTACRVADAARGAGSVLAADARHALGRHYASIAQGQQAVPAQERTGLLRRAQAYYTDADRIYRAALGDTHEKTRFAAEGLASAREALAPPAEVAQKPPAPAEPARKPAADAPSQAAAAAAPAREAAARPPARAQSPAPDKPQQAAAQARPAPAAAPERPARAARTAPPPTAEVTEAEVPVIIEDEDAPPRQATGEARRRAEGGTAVLGAASASTAAMRPSFDCDRARSVPERLICADPELAERDRELGRLHARARIVALDAAAFKRQNDAEWRRREASCRDRDCLLQWYEARREQLLDTLAEAESGAR